MIIRNCLGLVTLLFTAMGFAYGQNEGGIRCAPTRGRVNVSPEQWKIVCDAFLSHDVKRIVDFEDWRKDWPRSRKESAYLNATKTKKQFLKDVSELKFGDSSHTVSTGAGTPGLIFAWLWIYLGEDKWVNDKNTAFKPAKSIHHRSDVWWLVDDLRGKDFGFGRVRFVCEDGWLKVAEIKVHLPIDP